MVNGLEFENYKNNSESSKSTINNIKKKDIEFLDDNSKDSIQEMLSNISQILLIVTQIQQSKASLSVDKQYKAYFENYIKPIVELVYILSFTSQNIATMVNIYKENDYGKKGDLKKILDTSYDVLEEAQRSIKILNKYLDVLERNFPVELE